MAPPHTAQRADQADWALMIAIHDALRRDLDQLPHDTASHASARARWGTFRSQLLARPQTRLDSHLAHEETDAQPLVSQILSPGELRGLAAAIRGGQSLLRVGTTVSWALTGASLDIRQHHFLSQLPIPARFLYRTIWPPRHARTTPAL
jgi:hypothetical protein